MLLHALAQAAAAAAPCSSGSFPLAAAAASAALQQLARGRPALPWGPSSFRGACSRPGQGSDGSGSNAAASSAAAAAAADLDTAAAAPESVVAPLATPPHAPGPLYSLRQVSKHATEESCWIVVDGEVFDVTSYLDDHPGGAESILLNAGIDASDEFNPVHSAEAKALLQKFKIGTVSGAKPKPAAAPGAAGVSTAAAAAAAQPAAAAATTVEQVLAEVRELRPPPPPPPPPTPAVGVTSDIASAPVTLVDPRARYDLPLESTERLNHDTFLMRFALPSAAHRVGLPCGKHVFLFADIDGESVARAYTPLSSDRDLGRLDLLIKVYWANEHPAFPGGGKMSQHLARLKPGDTVSVKGPMGKFEYHGGGKYTLNRRQGDTRWLSMIAGGSGITPCYAVLREALADPTDPTRMALLYANKTPGDIWLKKELDELAAQHPDRFHVRYVLEQPPPGWTGSSGRVNVDMLAQHLLPPGPASLALMCGPPPMLEHTVVPGLRELGFKGNTADREDMVVF